MTFLEKPSLIEKIAGSALTQGGLAIAPSAIATVATGSALAPLILAPLMPYMANTIASARFSKRIESALNDIQVTIETYANEHAEAFANLSESQFKIINETVITLLQTMDDKKIDYLKQVVSGTLARKDIIPQEAAMLSRVLRDITAEEVEFLVSNFQFKRILIGSPEANAVPLAHLCWVTPNTTEALVVRGLASLGMLSGVDTVFDYKDVDCFSSIASKLLALLGVRRDV